MRRANVLIFASVTGWVLRDFDAEPKLSCNPNQVWRQIVTLQNNIATLNAEIHCRFIYTRRRAEPCDLTFVRKQKSRCLLNLDDELIEISVAEDDVDA